MTWVRLDEEFARHPKIVQAGPLAMAMQVAALCYCNQYLTDGYVPHDVVATLLNLDGIGMHMWKGEVIGGGEDATWKLIAEDLVDCGVWSEISEHGGFQIHDYNQYQPARVDVLDERRKAKERQAKARKSRVESQ